MNAAVKTSETFRYSIERALSPEIHSFPATLAIGDIEGEQAFLAGESDHISGLRAEGDTLTIKLVEPAPDFLARLSVPVFCPVPTDTPMIQGGVGAHASYPHRVAVPVPSAGPYYIADHLDGEYTILKRNPNYAGQRPHAFDAIALREGVDPGLAVRLVERGQWDGIAFVSDPLLVPSGPEDEKYGAEDASVEGPSYYALPSPLTGVLAFNTSRPPFSDPDVRRAVALALDRESIAAIWGNVATDQLVPPMLPPGSEDREVFPLDGSGLEETRSLMRGRTFTVVYAFADDGSGRNEQEAEVVRTSLAKIGISVEIQAVPDLYEGGLDPRGTDLFGTAAEAYWGDPVELLSGAFGLFGLFRDIPPPWVPDGVAEEIEALSQLTGQERWSAAASLADRLANDDVVVAPELGGANPTLLSSSLGCRVFPPFGYGVDLAALCPSEG